jgi:hypothetical protein
MPPFWVLFGFAALLALGWSLINGFHRRNAAYKERLRSSVTRFPLGTTRKLLRLMAPTSFKDRWNHATVLAGCVCIIASPIYVIASIAGYVGIFVSLGALLSGSLAGAYLGELCFNSWGCALVVPTDPNLPLEAGADAQKG